MPRATVGLLACALAFGSPAVATLQVRTPQPPPQAAANGATAALPPDGRTRTCREK
jgi:hypothetical protein